MADWTENRIDASAGSADAPDDEWTLTADQMIFMLQHHNAIEQAYTNDDDAYLEGLTASDEYRVLFGDMSFDEAYDRYECTIEESGDAT